MIVFDTRANDYRDCVFFIIIRERKRVSQSGKKVRHRSSPNMDSMIDNIRKKKKKKREKERGGGGMALVRLTELQVHVRSVVCLDRLCKVCMHAAKACLLFHSYVRAWKVCGVWPDTHSTYDRPSV